jgi:hypothetical protein
MPACTGARQMAIRRLADLIVSGCLRPALYFPSTDLFNQQKLTTDQFAWRIKPSWYVLATGDHTVNPDLQRWVSKSMGAHVTEVASSHVPMLSRPDVVIEVIRKAAASLYPSSYERCLYRFGDVSAMPSRSHHAGGRNKSFSSRRCYVGSLWPSGHFCASTVLPISLLRWGRDFAATN